jgi:hypothetical protein
MPSACSTATDVAPGCDTDPSTVVRKIDSGAVPMFTGPIEGVLLVSGDRFQGHHANRFWSQRLIACVTMLLFALFVIGTILNAQIVLLTTH